MGKLRQRREEEIARASRVIFETEDGQTGAPQISGKLRSFAPPYPGEVFREIMAAYREGKPHP